MYLTQHLGLFVFILRMCLLLYVVDNAEAQAVANGTFTSAVWGTETPGDQTVNSSCPFDVTGHTLSAYGAYILTRFNTEILATYFMHDVGTFNYAYKTDVDNNKWVIVNPNKEISGFTPFNFYFEFEEYLPNGPEGTCHVFSTLQEAQDMAESAPELNPAARDELMITSCQYSDVNATDAVEYVIYNQECTLTFPGWLRYNQGHILITFPFSVKRFSDVGGHYVVNEATDPTWYLVRVYSKIQSSITHRINFDRFKNVGNESQVYDIVVGLYASEDDALTDVLSSSTTTQATTTTLHTPTTPTPPTTTYTLTVSTSPIEIEYTESGNRKELKEFVNLTNTIVDVTSLWIHTSPHFLRCARDCIADNQCVSIFYNTLDKQCVAHSKVYGTVYQKKDGERYYVIV